MTETVLTRSQASRRRRILDAALKLAESGGYEAVQMREVSTEADVAIGTLYRYFPSKDHLLVAAMVEQIAALRERLSSRPPQGSSPVDRVVDVLGRATRGFLRERNVMTAMLRALVSADPSLADLVSDVRETMSAIITEAIHPGAVTERDQAVARVLEYAWMGSLVSWLNGVNAGTQVVEDLEAAARLVLED